MVERTAEGLEVGDVLICSHPDCHFEVTIKIDKVRAANFIGPVKCVCAAVMVPKGEKKKRTK